MRGEGRKIVKKKKKEKKKERGKREKGQSFFCSFFGGFLGVFSFVFLLCFFLAFRSFPSTNLVLVGVQKGENREKKKKMDDSGRQMDDWMSLYMP